MRAERILPLMLVFVTEIEKSCVLCAGTEAGEMLAE